MLQIATGKLFIRPVLRTNRLRGVLYTNARFGFEERVIETAAGTLTSTSVSEGVQSIMFEMDERIETHSSGKDILISHTLGPFLDDFAIVGTFGLNVMMSADRDLVRDLTPKRADGENGLSRYVGRVFDPAVYVSDEETESFVGFVAQLIGLERLRFLEAMRAIRTYVSALQRLPDNPAMAYALMVSAVEALAQSFDDFEPTWDDIEVRKRTAIDAALQDAPEGVSQAVRAALVSTEHAALGRRYRAFVSRFVDRQYLRAPDAGTRPVSGYELQPALKRAYQIRSKYLHALKRLPDDIAEPHGDWETVMIEREPALTFRGLARLTRRVILGFIAASPTVESEPYNYILETSGVRMMEMASQYWVGHPLQTSSHARRRLEGFLEQYGPLLRGAPGAQITDMRPVLGDVERLMPQAPASDRPALLALHYLFNGLVPKDMRTPACEIFLETWGAAADDPSAEAFIARTLFDNAQDWDAATFRKAHDLYFEQRLRPSGFHAPRLFEAAAVLALADRVRAEGETAAASELVAAAIECCPENSALSAFEATYEPGAPIDWRALLFPPQTDPAEPEGSS